MIGKDKIPPGLAHNLWKLGFWGLSAISIILLVMLWLSGERDTKEAMSDGRRLLISLENGTIEGKQISLEKPESPKPADASATSPATAVSTATSPASSPATTPAATHESPAPESPVPGKSAPAPESPMAASQPAATEPAAPQDNEAATSVTATPAAPIDTASIQSSATPPPPVNELLTEKTTDSGRLPIIGPRGLKSWSYYAKPYAHKGHLPTIAIIITGLGQSRLVTESALRLPENISLSFSPYVGDLKRWAQAARSAGHELFLDLPLEPNNFPASDPGPYGLLVGKGPEENTKRLRWLMSRLEGYVGFIAPLNESFSNNDPAFKSLLAQLSARGLMINMAHEPAKNETKVLLDASQVAYTIADVIIDEELSTTSIQARLLTLEKTASKRGFAIGLAQPFPITIQQLQQWSADLEKNGYTLVPLTFITKIKFPNS